MSSLVFSPHYNNSVRVRFIETKSTCYPVAVTCSAVAVAVAVAILGAKQPQGAAKAEPTVLALGVDGGFRTDEQKYDVVKTHRLVVLKPGSTEGFSVSFPDEVRFEV